MTRRADTDMTCSRGKAGAVGYDLLLFAGMFLNVCKNGQAIISLSRRYLALPFGSLTF